jgi:hypothetical protein
MSSTPHRPVTRAVLAVVVALTTLTSLGLLAGRPASAGAATPVEPAPPAVPHPFGKLSCVPQNGVRFCPGGQRLGSPDLRVPSFDGVPLDADVTLPATGKGPFPLIVLLHGLGESKAEWEVSKPDTSPADENNVALASNGWAVLDYTARGFGDSCGSFLSRVGTPACNRGWIQLADQRYEVRDTQYLAGELVDEGLVRPGIAVAGLSYGGGQSLELATLRNRVRLVSGAYVPWTSPVHHVPLQVSGAFAQWAWDDLADALVPNGHLSTTSASPPVADVTPIGVPKLSWNTLLYGVTAVNYLAPRGKDPASDLTSWYLALLKGEPTTRTDTVSVATVQQLKSAIGIPLPKGGPAPTAILNGWTDSLFPASEATHYADRVTAAGDHPPMLLMFGDVGHGWAQNKADTTDPTVAKGLAFLDATVRDHTTPTTGVVAYATTCPMTAPVGAPRSGPSLASLQHGSITLAGPSAQTVTSVGGSPATAAALNPAYAGRKYCQSLPAARQPGTAVYLRRVGSSPVTLLGGAAITAHLHVIGRYPQVVGRLWDVSPNGTRQLVAINVYRPSVNQRSTTSVTASASTTMTFDLNPNEYTFAAGHSIELELVGSNAPLFRPSNGVFTVTVSQLTARLPTA